MNLFNKLQNATYTANGSLAFLPSWVPPVDDLPHEPLFLSATGAEESFKFGAELRKKYNLTAGGSNFTFWSVFSPFMPSEADSHAITQERCSAALHRHRNTFRSWLPRPRKLSGNTR